MYDLRVLERLNYEAHLRSVARSESALQERSTSPPKKAVYPLSILASRLISSVPHLSYIIELFEDSDVINDFIELVREYLPDYEGEIRSLQGSCERMGLFSHYFEQRYFPLDYEMYADDGNLEGFVYQIPVALMGFNLDDYHSFMDYRTGYIVLLAITESPFYVDDDGNSERIPILSHIGDLFGNEMLNLIPANGWDPAFLHQRTDGTDFDGVGVFADWIHSQTCCWVLDATYDDYQGEQWGPYIVEALTEQWPRVSEILDMRQNVVEYIEASPKKRFLELLNLLLDDDKEVFIVPVEQLPLPL